VDIGNMSA